LGTGDAAEEALELLAEDNARDRAGVRTNERKADCSLRRNGAGA
jgi:hypothetical protein